MKMEQMAWYAVLICAVAAFFIYQPLFAQSGRALTVSFLDVGQGDAVFIESPTGRQVLIDGGKDRSVLRELGDIMPWNDRSIDIIIATHPDMDHIGGLVHVLDRYDVAYIFESGVAHDSPIAHAFEAGAASEGALRVTARRGQRIDIGGAYIDVLFPDRPVPDIETNTGSVITRIVHGDTAFMLTGDAPKSIEKFLVADGLELSAGVLKVGHHGSKTSSAREFVEKVNPQYAVFSYGCGNSYGHPHQEVVEVFAALHAHQVSTCEDGTVVFVSDGTTLRQK